jgi:hypothetical protein
VLCVAEDSFTLGVRERLGIYDLRDGTEELTDLDRDPTSSNLAASQPALRRRQRLAAWTEANRRQYENRAQ